MEILAPAGNRAALERADAAGADAVYLGYAAFSARAGAGNFDRRELEEAIDSELTDQEIANIAREKLGYAYYGEHIYINITGK